MTKKILFFLIGVLGWQVLAADLTVNSSAPGFSLKNQDGKDFNLEARKGKWTVLYFYPKSETPGCTKQACAFRDNLKKIQALGADVVGISINSVQDQAQFKTHHNLNFELLADEEGKVTELFGAKMIGMKMAKRWTFILDPKLAIRAIDKDVDPVKDADRVANVLKTLQTK